MTDTGIIIGADSDLYNAVALRAAVWRAIKSEDVAQISAAFTAFVDSSALEALRIPSLDEFIRGRKGLRLDPAHFYAVLDGRESAAGLARAFETGRPKPLESYTEHNLDAPRELAELEAAIARGLHTFVEVGRALARIRDGQLYRDQHETFEAYCAERWEMGRAHAYRLISAAAVAEDVSHGRHQDALPPPASERQAREVARLPREDWWEAWNESLETAPGGKVTAAHVATVVDKRLAKPKPAPEPFHILIATGDLKSALQRVLDKARAEWPAESQPAIEGVLRDMADDLARERQP